MILNSWQLILLRDADTRTETHTRTHMKTTFSKLLGSSALLLLLGINNAQAQLTSLYDYFNTLTNPAPAQTGTEAWTFYRGDQTGSLLPIYSADAYGNPSPTLGIIGLPGPAGSLPGTAGSSDTTGVFLHTFNGEILAASLNLSESLSLQKVIFTHEMLQNGNQGNGIGVTLRTVINNVVTDYGRFVVTNTTSAQTAYDFGLPGLGMNAGDKIVALFDANGTYLYDHGWFDINFASSSLQAVPGITAVPEPSTYALMGAMGLGALAGARRLRSRKKKA